jgi:tetraprenyl-beta-curcumene synthase
VLRGPAIGAEGAAVAVTFARYQGTVLPRVRRELEGWRRAAALIPDAVLREQALAALNDKAANAEATGVLACLAPRRGRGGLIRAATALQVAVDYLDSLGEQPGPDPLRDGLALHGALAAALDPNAGAGDWYAHHPQREDGGYLEQLVLTCRRSAAALPSAEAILPLARRAVVRCGEGQSHTHAAAGGGDEALRSWASALDAQPGFEWWELAAGASSSVAAHALLALAATPRATAPQAELVDAAYFPSIGALTVLLDDLVDRDADRAAGEHSYLRHYPSDAAAAERIEAIASHARRAVSRLPQAARHGAILSGILSFYLSSLGAAEPGAQAAWDRLLASSGPAVRFLTRVLERGTMPDHPFD